MFRMFFQVYVMLVLWMILPRYVLNSNLKHYEKRRARAASPYFSFSENFLKSTLKNILKIHTLTSLLSGEKFIYEREK